MDSTTKAQRSDNIISSGAGDIITTRPSSVARRPVKAVTILPSVKYTIPPHHISLPSTGGSIRGGALSITMAQHDTNNGHVEIETRPRGNTMTTMTTVETDDDDHQAMTDESNDGKNGVDFMLLVDTALSNGRHASSAIPIDCNTTTVYNEGDGGSDDEGFDESNEVEFLHNFLSGKLSVPYSRKRRHSIA